MKRMAKMKNRIRLGAAAAIGLLLAAGDARANNLQITNVTASGRNNSTAYVQFDIKWDSSWRYASGGDPLYFHDAAWVFFKVLPEGQTEWKHITLEGTGTNPTDYVIGTGTPIEMVVPSDRVGMFVRRSGEGAGTTSVQNVKAVWNFASNSLAKTDRVKIQAFGVEMAYVAEGAFKVGSGGTGSGELFEGGGGTSPFAITNAGPIPCSNLVGCLWGASTSGENSMGGNGTISNTFPNGFSAFYCMKYEVTQGQYTDFLNALTSAQQANRYSSSSTGTRYTIGTNTVGVFTNGAPDRACSYLSWDDGCAFADWAGLRPMTELEFEKACRGPLDPVANEYAWGSATISKTTAIANDGTGTDTATGGNCNYDQCSPDGPYRVGIYATSGATRVAAGAGYWGIMELSGNLYEWPVSIGSASGRAFTGLHGNGVLTTAGATPGAADVSGWPGPTGWRGGTHAHPSTHARVSDRIMAAIVRWVRGSDLGSRAVRTAP